MAVQDQDSGGEMDAETAADAIFEVVGNPVREVSLFYVLWYLVNVEGVEEAEFDLQQVVDRQYQGFYWYGIFSVVAEMSHAGEKYLFRPAPALEQTWPEDSFPDTVAYDVVHEYGFEGDMEESLDVLFQDPTNLLLFQQSFYIQQRVGPDRGNVSDALRVVDGLLDGEVFETPADFVRRVNGMWTRMEGVDGVPWPDAWADQPGTPPESEAFVPVRWRLGYQGDAWFSILDHLLRRDDPELTPALWVDTSWSIEHNTETWLNKITKSFREKKTVADVQGETMVHDHGVEGLVVELLDAIGSDDLGKVFEWAVRYNDEVGVNLQRYRYLFGEP